MAPSMIKSAAFATSALIATASVSGYPDLQGLRDCLTSNDVPASFPDEADWAALISPFNLRVPHIPAAVATPNTTAEVAQAVLCAATNSIKVQARSGGHSYAAFGLGGLDGGLTVDLASLNDVTVLEDTTATIGGGVRLGNLDLAIFEQGQRAMSHGTCANVGIGGHSTHGGYGYDSRIWGLALDHILSVEVVTADGSIKTASSTEEPDLFYALRGAADSFGIVTQFHVRTQPAPESLIYWVYGIPAALASVATATAAFQHIQDFALNATVQSRALTWGIYIDNAPSFTVRGKYFGTLDDFNNIIAPELLRTLPAPATTDVREVDWLTSQALYHDGSTDLSGLSQPDEPAEYQGHDNFFAKSITVPESEPLTEASLTSYFTYILNNGNAAALPATGHWFSIINLYGGPDSQINAVPIEASAYRDRDSLWVLQNYAFVDAGSPFNDELIGFTEGLNNALTSPMPDTEFGAYLNYVDPSLTPDQAHELYYGEEIYERLVEIKGVYDPDNVFFNPQAVTA